VAEAAPGASQRLADYTTLRLGGPARRLVLAESEEELVAAVRSADAAAEPVLVLGGGSNLVIADEGFAGTVVRVQVPGIAVEEDTCGGAMVTVAAGEAWDALVVAAVDRGWVGVEALSGIPGTVGASPIQNVGAYGQEVAQTVASVRCWDRQAGAVTTFASADCGFGYRTSRFKQQPERYVVLSVRFQFRLGDLGAPVAYPELAHALGVDPGSRAPARRVREAVLDLRGRKGMVLDAADHDTWSAGSFFTNPILDVDQVASLPAEVPRWPQPGNRAKVSAAWLIEHAGFHKGHGNDRVSVSSKHTLALTNRGSASTLDLLELAAEIQDGVHAKFGVWLVNEPVLVGCALPSE
jgi:UDP-N-acetylmuramate dehydrogenase